MDELYVAIVSVSIVLISIISSIKLLLKPGGSRPPLPPGPRGLPIVGYLPFLGNDLLHKLKDLEQKYGPIYKLHLGSKLQIVISSPSLVKDVIRNQDGDFANPDTSVAVYVATFGGNDVASSLYNSQWRRLRKVFVHEMMSHRRLEESTNIREEAVRKAIKHVETKMGEAIDIGELCYSTQFKVFINMSWGGTVEGELGQRVAADFGAVLSKCYDLIGQTNISDYYPFLARLDIQGIKKQMESCVQTLDSIFDTIIAQHYKNKKSFGDEEMKKEARSCSSDFLQILLELNEEKAGGDSEMSISQKQLRGMLMDVVGAVSETAATTEWAMSELMNNPEIMAKTLEELSRVVGLNNSVQEVHIPKLKYLEAVVKETLRLHPTDPLKALKSSHRSSTVGGYTIPSNTGLMINIWSIQTNPSLWDNPTEFKPERFLHGKWESSGGYHFQYLPFGSGRRICAGQALAERMILLLLASLVHSFDWKLPQGEILDMSSSGHATKKATPLVVIPKPRVPASSLFL